MKPINRPPTSTASSDFLNRHYLCLCLLLALCPFALTAQTAHPSGSIITVHGGLSSQFGVAVDSNGDLFVADAQNGVVDEFVAVNGVVSASASPIHPGSNNLTFSEPTSVAVDSHGNVFVGDSGYYAVFEIVATNGVVSASSTVNQLATNGNVGQPAGVAVDANGNVFVADSRGQAVYEIPASAPSTSITLGSNLSGGFSAPRGITVDSHGSVFVADAAKQAVYEIVATAGAVSANSVVNAVGSGFSAPFGVAVDANGNVFVAEANTHLVKEIVAVSGAVSSSSTVNTVANGFALTRGLALNNSGNLFVADPSTKAVEEISSKFPATVVGSTSGVMQISFTFDTAGTLAATPYVVLTKGALNLDFKAAATQPANACAAKSYSAGSTCSVNVIFTPTKPYQRMGALQLMGSAGMPIATVNISATGVGPQVAFPSNTAVTPLAGTYASPCSVAVDGSGNIFVADNAGAVKKIVAVNGVLSPNSSVVTVGSGFFSPTGVAVDGAGDVFVSDSFKGVKEIVAANGAVSSSSSVITVGSGFTSPKGVAVDANGNVFVGDGTVKEVVAVNGAVSSSSTINTVGSGFNDPSGVAIDGNGNVYVADLIHNAVKQIVAVSGVVSSTSSVVTLGSGFSNPQSVAVDGSGNVFVADTLHNAVKEIVAVNGVVSSTSSVITLGSGFSSPEGVAVDSNGNVFVADLSNNPIKEIDYSDAPSLAFANTNAGSQSAAQSVTVENIGNATLNETTLAVSGNFAQIAGGGTLADCPSTPATLASGAACNVSLVFAPTTGGSLSGTAVLKNNNLDASAATQTINLSGTGVAVNYSLTIQTSPSGLAFTLDGANYTAPQTLTLAAGTHTLATTATQTPTAGSQYTFATWSDGGSASHSITVSANATYTAAFNTLYSLTVTANPTAGGTVTGSGYYAASSSAVITATPSAGYVFTGWSGATTSTSASTSVTMTAPLTATASFLQAQTITFNSIPAQLLTAGSLGLTAAASSGLAITYTSQTASVCTVSGSTVTLVTAGTCTIQAAQAGSLTYAPATATQTFSILGAEAVTLTSGSANFGNANVCPGGVATTACTQTNTLTFTVAASDTLATPIVVTQGAANLDFTLGAGSTCTGSVIGGATCTVVVNFNPLAPGLREGAVQLLDGSGNLLTTQYISGIGVGPRVAYGPGAQSMLSIPGNPFAVAADNLGNFYISNGPSGSVFKVPVGGCPTTGCQAIVTGLTLGVGLGVDGAGNVFVADRGNSNIVEVPAAGCPTTSTCPIFASNIPNMLGLAVDAAGNVYVTHDDSAVRQITQAGVATEIIGNLSGLRYIGLDSAGNLYLPVSGQVLKLPATPGATSPFGASVSIGSGFGSPTGVVVDAAGDVFVADYGAAKLFEIPADGSAQIAVASGSANPSTVAVDPSGNLYVIDYNGGSPYFVQRSQPPTLNFASTVAGQTSSAQSVAIQNIGNAQLTATALTIGPNFTQILGTGGAGAPPDCASTSALTAGASCNLGIAFAPGSPGSLQSTAVLTSNAFNSPSTIPLSGTATPGPVAISVGTSVAGLAFTIDSGTTSYTSTASFMWIPGSTHTLTTTSPQTLNNSSYAFTQWSDGTTTLTDSITVPAAVATYTAVFLPSQTITFNSIPPQLLSAASLALSATASSGLAVTYNSQTIGVCTVSGGAVTFVTVGTCTIQAAQAGNANWAPAAPVTQSFTILGSEGVALTSGSTNFGNVNVCPGGVASACTTPQTTTLTYTLAAADTLGTPLVLTLGARNLDFMLGGATCNTSVAGGATCTVTVNFTPLYPGLRMGAVEIVDSYGKILSTTYISGIGVGPQIAFPSNSATTTLPSGSAGFSYPTGVAVDGAGDVFVADNDNNAVKEIVAVNGVVSASSTVITVGSGFSYPNGVAVDGAGDVFVADFSNRAVKEIVAVNGVVSASSTVITVGSGFSYPNGVAVDGAGDVFVADYGDSEVKEIVALNGAVSASSAVVTLGSGFAHPYALAVDSVGDVFVADYSNNAVKEIVAVSGVVSASSSVIPVGSGFSHPAGVAVDSAGDVFVADYYNSSVKEIVAASGAVSSSSTVIAVGTGLSYPQGVAVDGAGNIFVADYGDSAVKGVNRSTPPALTFASTAVGQTSSDSPQSVTIQNIGNATLAASALTVGTNFAQTLLNGTPADCTSTTTLASGASCNLSVSFTPAALGSLTSTAVLTDNSLNNPGTTHTIPLAGTAGNLGSANVCPGGVTSSCTPQSNTLTFDVTTGETLGTPIVLTDGAPNLDFTLGTGSTCSGAVSTATCTVVVNFTPRFAGLRRGAVEMVDNSGNILSTTYISGIGIGPQISYGPAAATTIGSNLKQPYGVTEDGAGNLYIADYGNKAVYKVAAASGTQTTVAGNLQYPGGVAVDGAGNLYIADAGGAVFKVSAGTGAQTKVGNNLKHPSGVAVDGAGNVYIADGAIPAVYKLAAGTGTQTTVGSNLPDPSGVAVDGAGNVYISDFSGYVYKVAAGTGTQTTVGTNLTEPYGVAVDAAGDVFIADWDGHAVYEVPANGSAQIKIGAAIANDPQGVAVDAAGNVFIADESGKVYELQQSQAPSLTFANTAAGQTSSDSPQSVTIQNIGNAALTTSALTVSANFTQTLLNGTPADCTNNTNLALGASCNLSISFTPTTSGPLTGTATLTDNALNATAGTQSIALSGTGIASNISVTVSASIPGLSFSVDGTPYTASQTFSWVPGSTHTLATTSPQSFSPGTQYLFTQWSDGTTSTTDTVTASASVTSYTATFTTQYLLTTIANPSSGGTLTGGGYINAGTAVTLTATPTIGYFLASWTGPITSPAGNSATVTMNAPETVTANFALGIGSWPSVYGADGFVIANDPMSKPPSYATVTVTSDTKAYTWQSPSTDPRALQTAPGVATRIASSYWSDTSFNIAVNVNDSNSHQLTLYLLDWDASASRAENITVTNTANNTVLSSQCYTGFHGGQYVSWTISSSVSIQVTSYKDSKCTAKGGAPNAVVSGIFFDKVPAATQSTYNGADTTTQGTYTGIYGGQGGMIANNTTPVTSSSAVTQKAHPLLTGLSAPTLPSYATVSLTGANAYTWVNPTSDVRALQTSNGSANRIASAYYSPTSFTMNVNLTDGQPHLVSLYLLDWDSNARQEKITILDANTKNVLDTETYANFHNGEYASWLMTGHVLIQVMNTAGTKNAVVSGIFFDAAAAGVAPTAMPGPIDTATQGAWGGVYGTNGNAIATEPASLASFANVTVTQDAQFTWASPTSDVRALQTTSDPTTLAATCYYSAGTLDINVDLTDGQPHKVSFYLVDWDKRSRVETITVLDAEKGTVLGSPQNYANFQGGQYASWTVTGHVLFQVKKTSGPNAVVSGVFID